MPVFSKKSQAKGKDDVFVGAFIPPQINSFLTLYCIQQGCSKTVIQTELLEEWVGTQETNGVTAERLCKDIGDAAYKSWKEMGRKKPTLPQLVLNVEKELQRKHIDKKYIDLIKKQIEDGENQQ